MSVQLSYRPLRIYEPAHASTARHRLLVGGFGTGKTMALCADAISRGLQVPGLRICLSRVTAPEVRDTLEPVFLDVMPHELYTASETRRAGGHLESITMPNGTKFLFRAIDDWQKHKSLNLALWYADELSEFDEGTYTGMSRRTRQVELTSEARALGHTHTVPEWIRGTLASTNPNGHDWIWRAWVDAPNDEHEHWIGTSLDNPHLTEDYLRDLLAMPEAWVRRYVMGSFDEFGGLVYPEWTAETHMYRGSLDVSRATPVWQGLDPGTRHPTAALWVVVKGGVEVAVREHKQAGLSVKQHAAAFRAKEAGLPPVTWRVGDPNSLHVRDRGTQVSLHRQYAKQGFHFQNGPSSHQDRIPMLGALVKARRILATPQTPMFFEQMQDYRWEQLTSYMRRKLGGGEEAEEYGPERPVKVKDDLVDCAQYLSSRLAQSPQQLRVARREPRSEARQRADEVHAGIRRHQRRKALQSTHDLGGIPV